MEVLIIDNCFVLYLVLQGKSPFNLTLVISFNNSKNNNKYNNTSYWLKLNGITDFEHDIYIRSKNEWFKWVANSDMRRSEVKSIK